MSNILDIDEKIRLNKEALAFFHANYQRTQIKVTILVLMYSVIAVYIVPILKYTSTEFYLPASFWDIAYMILFASFVLALLISLRLTYLLLRPVYVAFLNHPRYYYRDIRNQYSISLETDREDILNAYIEESYLSELELAVERNSILFESKSRYYYKAFNFALLAILLYLLCTGFLFFRNEKKSNVSFKNQSEITTTDRDTVFDNQ